MTIIKTYSSEKIADKWLMSKFNTTDSKKTCRTKLNNPFETTKPKFEKFICENDDTFKVIVTYQVESVSEEDILDMFSRLPITTVRDGKPVHEGTAKAIGNLLDITNAQAMEYLRSNRNTTFIQYSGDGEISPRVNPAKSMYWRVNLLENSTLTKKQKKKLNKTVKKKSSNFK